MQRAACLLVGARELAMAMVAGALARADLRALNVGLRAPPRRAWTAHALALGVSRCMGGPDRVHVPPIAHVKGSQIALISLDQLENN